MIRLIKQKVKDEFPYVSKLIAKVKPSNAASIYCFENNQFEESLSNHSTMKKSSGVPFFMSRDAIRPNIS